jgi:hypothetical protein
MLRTMFDIGADLEALTDLLAERGGDISDPDVDAAVTAWFAELSAEEGAKLDRVYGLIRQFESEEAVYKAEADEYARRSAARGAAARRLKDMVRKHIEMAGRRKAVSAAGRTFTVCINSSNPVVFQDGLDPRDVPDEFVRLSRVIDGKAVRAALVAGTPLPWAAFGPRGSHLRIN